MVKYFVIFLIAFGASLALTPLVRLVALRLGALDQPGERKIHGEPIPRLGGVAVVAAVLITLVAAVWLGEGGEPFLAVDLKVWLPVLVGGSIIFIAGIWDDIRPLPAGKKFLFQAAAAMVAITLGVRVEDISFFGNEVWTLGLFTIPVTFLWLVGITNAFNLVDGLDGLAAGLASIAAGTCATIFLLRGDAQDALLLVILLGALLGFLRYNFNPAQIFLGDSGSLVIGYTLAISAIAGSQKKATALAVVVPLLVFGIPILDTVLSMIRRFVGELKVVQPYKRTFHQKILMAKQMFGADQGHIHHRLIALGFSHRNAVIFLYGVSLGLSGLALLSVMAQYRNAGIILVAVGLATVIGIRKLGYPEIGFFRAETLIRWYERVTLNRLFFMGFLDLLFITFAYWVSFVLKYDFDWSPEHKQWYLSFFPVVLLIQLGMFLVWGLYQGVWRSTGIGDLIKIGLAVGSAASLSYAVGQLAMPPSGVTAFFVIDLLTLGIIVVGARTAYQVLDYSQGNVRLEGEGALIYGAGKSGQLVLQELRENREFGLQPLGFLDDDSSLKGRTVNQMPVLGTSADLPSILATHQVTTVVVASARLANGRLFAIAEVCRKCGIPVVQAQVHITKIQMSSVQTLEGYRAKPFQLASLPMEREEENREL